MGFSIHLSNEGVRVALTGWDRLMNWTSEVVFEAGSIGGTSVGNRGELEALIDHRGLGFGTHNGAKRPNRRRVGTMLGRGVPGQQFWAVSKGEPTEELLVLEVRDSKFKRAVLSVDDAAAALAALSRQDVK